MTLLFSELWEQSEKVNSSLSHQELFFKLKELFIEYQKLDNILSKELQKTLKTKKYGEILYILTQISRIDDINTYAALQLELQYLDKEKASVQERTDA